MIEPGQDFPVSGQTNHHSAVSTPDRAGLADEPEAHRTDSGRRRAPATEDARLPLA
jgi:hypothetical protein